MPSPVSMRTRLGAAGVALPRAAPAERRQHVEAGEPHERAAEELRGEPHGADARSVFEQPVALLPLTADGERLGPLEGDARLPLCAPGLGEADGSVFVADAVLCERRQIAVRATSARRPRLS